MESLRISAKNLGELALADFCPRCFWVKQHAKKLPFQIFPGIFNSIDAYTKRVEKAYFAQHDVLLQWLIDAGFDGEPLTVPHHTQFRYCEPATDVLLTGMPDAIFRLRDGTHAIIDYKTAKFSDTQDNLFPMYETQLNAYAFIGERNGFAPVSRLALLYYEPETEIADGTIDTLVRANGFVMGFASHLKIVECKPSMIPPMLGQFRKIYELPQPPAGRIACENCQAIDAMARLIESKG